MSAMSTLLLLGHGSSKHSGSSRSVKAHVELLRERGRFSAVHCGFLKEEPFIEDALGRVTSDELVIVPDFLAEGYFTRQVIPALLGEMPDGVRYCDPVGKHPLMRELIVDAAEAELGEGERAGTSLLLVGHGSKKNVDSKQTLLDHIEVLRETSGFAQVADLWLEEEPFVSSWRDVVTEERGIVVPFLLSDGQHGGWDVPEMLGIDGEVHGVIHALHGHSIRVAPALGTSPRFVEVIEDLAGLS